MFRIWPLKNGECSTLNVEAVCYSFQELWVLYPDDGGSRLLRTVGNVTIRRTVISQHTGPFWKETVPSCLCLICYFTYIYIFNLLAPNDVYIRRTAQLTSRRWILNIYSTNILTEYFKHAAHSPFFSLQDAVYFIMLSFLVPVIFTF